MQLTKNFTLEELTASDTAKARHIDNTPATPYVENLRVLCEEVLQPARDAFGKPIRISSGYRCPELNTAVGGVPNSYHRVGLAADLQVFAHGKAFEPELKRLFKVIKEQNNFDKLLYERSTTAVWIHVQYRRDGKNAHRAVSNYKA